MPRVEFPPLQKTRWPIVLVLILHVTLMIGGCAKSPTIVKVGLVGPFTGRFRDIGYDVIYSSRLAVREYNEKNGASDVRLSLVALDDFGDPETAERNARALAIDSDIVVVIGHWLTETTQAVQGIYEDNDLPLISTGQPPFGIIDPASLPDDFSRDYAELTPFDEVAGPYAASGYDAVQLVIAAVERAVEQDRTVNRQTVGNALKTLTIHGLGGEISQKR